MRPPQALPPQNHSKERSTQGSPKGRGFTLLLLGEVLPPPTPYSPTDPPQNAALTKPGTIWGAFLGAFPLLPPHHRCAIRIVPPLSPLRRR